MERKDLEVIEAFDPAKLTLEDLRQVKNTVLRQAVGAISRTAILRHVGLTIRACTALT